MKVDVTTLAAKKAGTVDLADEVFALEPRGDIRLRQALRLAKLDQQRQQLSLTRRAKGLGHSAGPAGSETVRSNNPSFGLSHFRIF